MQYDDVGVLLVALFFCCMWSIVILAICFKIRRTKPSTDQHCTNLEPMQREPDRDQGLYRSFNEDSVWCVHTGRDVRESALNARIRPDPVVLNTPVVLQVVLPPETMAMDASAPPPPYEEPPAYHTLCEEMRSSQGGETQISNIRQLLQPSPPAFRYPGQGTLV